MGRSFIEIQLKEKRFVESFCEHFNASQAAIDAGYSPKGAHVTACRMMKRKHIQAMFKERLKLSAQHAKLSPTYVIDGLRELIERCMQQKPATDSRGKFLGYYVFNPNAALKGYELLGRNYDMFSPDVIVHLDDELALKLTAARARAREAQIQTDGKDITNEVDGLVKLLPVTAEKSLDGATNENLLDELV